MPALASNEQRPEKNRSMVLYLRGIHESYKVGNPLNLRPSPSLAPSLVPPDRSQRYVVWYVTCSRS